MAKATGTVEINEDLCKGCELCVAVCPEDVLELSERVNVKGWLTIELVREGCTGCRLCAVACPDGVFTVYQQDRQRERSNY